MASSGRLAIISPSPIISFWALVPIGWGALGALAIRQGRGRARVIWLVRPRGFQDARADLSQP